MENKPTSADWISIYIADALRFLKNQQLEVLAVEVSLASNEQISLAVQKSLLQILQARKNFGVDLK